MAGYTGDMAFLTSLPIDDIKMLFREADKDNNGRINRQETINIFQSIFDRAGIPNIPHSLYNQTPGSSIGGNYQGLFPNIPDGAFGYIVTEDQFINSFIDWGNYLQTLAAQNPTLRIRNNLGQELSVLQVLQLLGQAITTRNNDDAMVVASDDEGEAAEAPDFNPGLQYQSSSQDSELQRALAESMTTTNASNGAAEDRGPAEEVPEYNPELQRQSTSKDVDLQRALEASMSPTEPQSQVKAPERILEQEAMDVEELADVKIRDWLDKDPNNFVLSPGGDTSWEAHSIPGIQARAVLPGEEGNFTVKPPGLPEPYFKMFYACNEQISEESVVDKSKVFVKISFNSTPIEKPYWVFKGPPPAPRVFRIVPTGESEILGANNWVDGWFPADGVLGADHCSGSPVPTYKLEPVIEDRGAEDRGASSSGGRRRRLKKRSRSKNKYPGSKRKSQKPKSSKKKTHKKKTHKKRTHKK